MFFSTLVTLLARLTGWKPPKMSKQIQHKVHYEFMGPPGSILIMTSLPIVSYALYFMCHGDKCASFNPYSKRFLSFDNPLETGFPTMFSYQALYIFLAWMALHVLIYLYFPGKWIDGVDLDGRGTRLKYKINAFLAFFVSIGVAVAAAFAGWIPATYGYDHFLELLTASMIFSFCLAIYLYAASHLGTSHTPQTRLAPHGNTGNIPYDFFIGRSLNPRIGALDLKYFCELRPGLIGWVLLDLSFIAAQYKRNGEITASIILVVLFHTIYVLDALWSEAAILTTMDITSDGFGWMLAFGDLAWVPFTYSLQARYLVDFPTHLALWQIAGILLLQLVGLYIFRTANNEKNDFRSNPNNPKFQGWYMTTERGSKLLIKGWWGRSRHPNYFGDLIMALAWALPSGFNDAFPYFYPLYFLILLVHRQIRDDHHCHEKYGKDWDKYCELVKYRIIPFVY